MNICNIIIYKNNIIESIKGSGSSIQHNLTTPDAIACIRVFSSFLSQLRNKFFLSPSLFIWKWSDNLLHSSTVLKSSTPPWRSPSFPTWLSQVVCDLNFTKPVTFQDTWLLSRVLQNIPNSGVQLFVGFFGHAIQHQICSTLFFLHSILYNLPYFLDRENATNNILCNFRVWAFIFCRTDENVSISCFTVFTSFATLSWSLITCSSLYIIILIIY